MFCKRGCAVDKILTVMIVLFLVSWVGCGKKIANPDLLKSEEIGEEDIGDSLESLEIASIERDFPPEEPIEIKDVKEVPDLKDVYFEFDKSDITFQSRQNLSKNAEWLRDNPEVKIIIEGHCDERGTIEYNLGLGQKRATNVRNYLITLGVEANRINTISYGEEKPADLRHNEEAWARNRRAHTLSIIED